MMLQRQLILLLILIFSFSLVARGQNYFQKLYSLNQSATTGLWLESLPNGKTLLLEAIYAGTDSTGPTKLVLLDEQGAILWSKIYQFESTTYGLHLAMVPDDNFLIGANRVDMAGVPFSSVFKISITSGDILWEKHFALPYKYIGSFQDVLINTAIVRMIPLSDQGYAVLASSRFSFSPDAVTVLFKLDENGELQWEQTWADGQGFRCIDLAENSLGELYLAGTSTDSVPRRETLLTKLSPTGVALWTRRYDQVYARQLSVDAADNLWFAGFGGSSPTSFSNIWVQKLQGDGGIDWSKLYRGPVDKNIEIYSLGILHNQDAMLCVDNLLRASNDCVMLRIEPTGSVRWARKYTPPTKYAHLLKATELSNGDLLASGAAGDDLQVRNPWQIKTDASGKIPDCCLSDFGISVENISPPIDLVEFHTTSSLQVIPGQTAVKDHFSTVTITSLCSAEGISGVANAFTPNGDQINDLFLPPFSCPPETMRFAVFNRWGNKVFESHDLNSAGWDGNVDMQAAPSDVYVWLLEYTTFLNGQLENKQERGEITLLR